MTDRAPVYKNETACWLGRAKQVSVERKTTTVPAETLILRNVRLFVQLTPWQGGELVFHLVLLSLAAPPARRGSAATGRSASCGTPWAQVHLQNTDRIT